MALSITLTVNGRTVLSLQECRKLIKKSNGSTLSLPRDKSLLAHYSEQDLEQLIKLFLELLSKSV